MERTVRELLTAAQQERKAKLDAGRVDTVFKAGDQVLLRTQELLDAADIGKLRPRWDGPFTVTACSTPNAYTLALPRWMLCSPTVKRGPAQALPRADRSSSCSRPSFGPWAGGRARGGAAAQQQDKARRHTLPCAVARAHVGG